MQLLLLGVAVSAADYTSYRDEQQRTTTSAAAMMQARARGRRNSHPWRAGRSVASFVGLRLLKFKTGMI